MKISWSLDIEIDCKKWHVTYKMFKNGNAILRKPEHGWTVNQERRLVRRNDCGQAEV